MSSMVSSWEGLFYVGSLEGINASRRWGKASGVKVILSYVANWRPAYATWNTQHAHTHTCSALTCTGRHTHMSTHTHTHTKGRTRLAVSNLSKRKGHEVTAAWKENEHLRFLPLPVLRSIPLCVMKAYYWDYTDILRFLVESCHLRGGWTTNRS